MTFKLQRIMRTGLAATLAAGLLLASLVVFWNLSAYRQHAQALAQFERFSMSIRLMAATSAERGPANLLMSAPTEPTAEASGRLAAARAGVDDQFDALAARFAEEMTRRDTLREDARSFRESLAEGRRAVDAVVATPPAERSPKETAQAIRAMFAAADRTQMLRDELGQVLIGLSPELTALLMAAVAVSDLREYSGRLGSLVVMRINAGGGAEEVSQSEFPAMVSLTDTLQRQIENYAAPFIQDPEIERAVKAVTFGYFTGARAYAETVFESPREGANVSVQAFNDRYVPGLRTTETLREKIMDVGRAKLIAERDGSLRLAGMSLAGAVLGGLAALAALMVFDRGVFRPLLLARQRMERILAGDLAAASGAPATSFLELSELDRDIEKLRRHQVDLRRLEDEREVLSRELHRLATTDPLTGLMNRRAFEDAIDRLFSQRTAIGAGFGIAMIDVDHFKAINDRHGHGVGDEVLRGIGRFLTESLAPGGLVARFGGEEFVMALPRVGRAGFQGLVEALRARLAATPILAEPRLRVTASFGVHWVPADGRLDWNEFHRTADDCLYQAKRNGRNRVASSA